MVDGFIHLYPALLDLVVALEECSRRSPSRIALAALTMLEGIVAPR